MKIMKRTFEAKYFARDSVERAKLNNSSVTSEYMPSYKYVICNDDGTTTPFTYRTKTEAVARLSELEAL